MNIKKLSAYFLRYLLVIFIIGIHVLPPLPVSAATNYNDMTLKEMKEELENLKQKKEDNKHEQEVTEAEKEAKNKAIADTYYKIEENRKQIEEAKQNIADSEARIAELEEQTNQLMAYYQILQGNNAYMEFVTDSSSMTELIMRSDAIAQLSSYNQDKLLELENLIKETEQKQVDLTEYENELNNNLANYQKQLEEINSSLLQFSDISMTIDGEIENLEDIIETNENMGCKESETPTSCAKRLVEESQNKDQDSDDTDYSWYINNYGWLKPVTKGRISSNFGWRSVPGQSSYHSGIDIAVSEGTNVYPAASGVVVRTVSRSSCGGNQIYIQAVINGEVYTMQYAHLLEVYVSKGDVVDVNDVIALSGGYSTASRYGGYDTCTTGAHLHFGVSVGAYTSFSNYTANLINPPGFPNKGSWFYSRTQWFD